MHRIYSFFVALSVHCVVLLVPILMPLAGLLHAQPTPFTADEIRGFVAGFKEDPRGPYQGIRWFCNDGSVRAPQERCDEPGGIQHALTKDRVTQLAARNGIFLGQILAGTDFSAFLDESNGFSRLKQYQLERYLARTDNGWIFRRAQYYRGAFQAEDEERWGRNFLVWLMGRSDLLRSRYFLMRESVRDIPHEAGENALQQIRALAKEVSDEYPAFMDVRVKIHGQPEASDTARVAQFERGQAGRLPDAQRQKLRRLQDLMRAYYRADPLAEIRRSAAGLPATKRTRQAAAGVEQARSDAERVQRLAQLMYDIRSDILEETQPAARLRLMDMSLAAESMLFRVVAAWRPSSLRDELTRVRALALGAVASGLLEEWEWQELRLGLEVPQESSIPETRFARTVESVKRAVEWSIGMSSSTFEADIAKFSAFEPLAEGFMDDRLRSTLLLPLGEASSSLGSELARVSGLRNEIMDLNASSAMRGLNPGVAVGRLVVVSGSAFEDLDFRTDEIYMMARAPADLKPVGGIATVSEGNMVSHVQLLARNLGIPNAVLTPELLRQLEAYAGRQVFYAVSPGGAVRLKLASDMTGEERSMVEEQTRSATRIRVPVDRLELSNTELTALFDLRANDSGRLCGPKAANLGQLSSLFPDYVAPGFIIPFGLFRSHMDQPMPGMTQSYWEFLRSTFAEGDRRRSAGENDASVEEYILGRLATLRSAIESMPLQPAFVERLRARFREVFGAPMGQTPVFVRSDTNMEDLKDFTGAGLNLTVPNVVDEAAFLQAIRRVWASPYRERGYRWRQKYLLNPEDVYPSLLVLKSVNVDMSGVLITTGVTTGNEDDLTAAFNRGVGGAVDGQVAETYAIHAGGYTLLAPAREPSYNMLPAKGGVESRYTTFERRILAQAELEMLRRIGVELRRRLPGTPGIESDGPFDVELGFLDGRLNLFQARPFVQNQAANSSLYLLKMDERPASNAAVELDARR